MAAEVAVADLTNVQQGFWVVLGALSVLRTNASSTGATALRALAGTAAGFLHRGRPHPGHRQRHSGPMGRPPAGSPDRRLRTGNGALRCRPGSIHRHDQRSVQHPGPGRLEGRSPARRGRGYGAAVSAAAGTLFWPRGATAVVGDDLAEAFHRGGVYVVQATAWAIGVRTSRPESGVPAVRAGARLDDALRGLLAEQGTKRVAKEHLWRLVAGALRLRLTAQSMAALAPPDVPPDPAVRDLVDEAVLVAGMYDDLAALLGRTTDTVARELAHLPSGNGPAHGAQTGHTLRVRQHLEHARGTLAELQEPAAAVAAGRSATWWR